MRRAGQAESSFQWVFVLVAGTSMLLLLFFFVRSCTTQGEQSTAGLSMLTTAQRIERVSWQPDGETDIPVGAADVVCTSGRVSFVSEFGSASLDRSSAFLPPRLSGDLHAVIRRIMITQSNSPGLELGSMLFGVDGATQYLIVSDSSGSYSELSEIIPKENRRVISEDDLTDPNEVMRDVPKTTNTLIIVTNKNEGHLRNAVLSDVPEGIDVRGVYVTKIAATFYTRGGDKLVRVRDLPVEHPLLGIGAAISADPAIYACAHEALSRRSAMLAHLYSERAMNLSSRFPGTCGQLLSEGAQALSSSPDMDIEKILNEQGKLAGIQLALLNGACPVIA